MKIKTKEAFQKARLQQKKSSVLHGSQEGFNRMSSSAEQTQDARYSSAHGYAADRIEGTAKRFGREAVLATERMGRWGIKETRKNIKKLYSKIKKRKQANKTKRLNPPKRKRITNKAPKTCKVSKSVVKQTAKNTKRIISLAKRAIKVMIKFIKVAIKAMVKTIKAIIAAAKAIVAAIAAGGWIAVIIIIVICVISALVGSVYMGFETSEGDVATITETIVSLEDEYNERILAIKQEYDYDSFETHGGIMDWRILIATYTVKYNLFDRDINGDVIFGAEDEEGIKTMFWEIHTIDAKVEDRIETRAHVEVDDSGKMIEIRENIQHICLVIQTTYLSIEQISEKYELSDTQHEMLLDIISGKYYTLSD